ncbi:MAG: sigma 54-interacting transcriptional regulator [Eubacterium sp.]
MNLYSDFKQLEKAWSLFVDKNIISDKIRESIADSWKRCRELNLNSRELNRTPSVSEAEFRKRLKQNQNLLNESIPFMMEIQEFVNDSGFSTTLTDKDGVILELICDRKILKEAFTKNLVRGSIWNERKAGTNATGLALIKKQPIQVIGSEHYFKCYHDLTCSASPIFDENNQLIAIMDMSGPKELSFPHTLGMVVAATKAISRQLYIAASDKRINVSNHYLKTLVESMDNGVVAVDINGKIIGINSNGAKILQTTTFDSYGKNILDIMEGETILYNRKNADTLTDEKHVITKSNKINCLVNRKLILYDNGEIAGAVATLKDMKKINVSKKKETCKGTHYTFDDIIGESSKLLRAVHLAKVAASSDLTVLLQGDSGTGKEMFAQAIHNAHQSDKPFIAINCSAIPEPLIESVLFGYEEGSFTGASRQGKKGQFERAEDGTVFLDEIGDMPLNIQIVLLRVLQERYIQRIGGFQDIPINARIIVATNKNLREEVEAGRFRQDLYYRLKVLEIEIPPLRERPGDLAILSQYFINKVGQKYLKNIEPLMPSTLSLLETYKWPGNVRQFYHAIEQAIYFTETNRIDNYFISDYLPNQDVKIKSSIPIESEDAIDLKEAERTTIKKALTLFPEKKKAAVFLGISRSTLYRKISQYHLDEE